MSLRVHNLQVRLASRPVLQDIGFAVERGTILALVGPNGAGKTSLLRTLSGDLEPAQGVVEWGERSLRSLSLQDRARHVAVLPQLSSLAFPFTVEEVVLLGRSPHGSGRERDRSIAIEAMASLDLAHLRARPYTRLSGGERQRVQLARVLTQVWEARSCLLLLDEPTSALDFAHQQLLVSTLRKLAAQGLTIVLATHDLHLAALHADRMLALKAGRCIGAGSAEEVIQERVMKALYGVDMQIIRHPQNGKPLALGL
ncbi:heme ABC transporter ATP-binding protein [Gilvimarinus sp. F26214L]|uniref:heme ABC transporter ATP-binding protein n=1 Tax=Gilvimarinus sp. DZF01 TaxID=3461371 RepID=UPI00404669FF